MPVAYLIGEDGTMLCFNKKNKLCAIADRYENVISIEWGDAVINGSVREAITAVYDGERKTALKYNCFGQLISVTDPDGNSAKYTYEGTEENSALIKTVYSNGKMLYFTYCADGLSFVRCNDHTLTKITYLNGIPAEITTYSTVDGITDETKPVPETYMYQTPYKDSKIISSVKIAYSADRVCIEEDGTSEYILKNGNGKTSGGYTVKNGKASGLTLYTRAERQYEITVTPKKRTEIKNPNAGMDNTVKKYLNNPPVIATLPYAAEEYRDYSEADWEFTELDKFNRPKFVNTNWRKTYTADTGKDVYKKTAVTYEYAAGSSEYNCIKKTTREYTKYDGNNSTGGEEMRVYAEEYSYCEHGNLVKTESYAEGEEGTSGVTVTEKVCDEKGNIIKQFTYNTLDSSTKFYTENEYADNGKVTAEADETGENKTKLIYNGGTDRVNTRILPNGGKLSYGYDESGNVTSVTQSTEDGEENSTNIKYTLNCPTRLTSGNNVVYYEYDYKRRPTKVTVNGTTTEYAYDDENGITAATFAGHTFTTKKNKDGNVVKTEADGAVQLEYTYANGLLKSIDDNVTGETVNYEYNVNKAVSKISSAEITEVYNYNDRNEIISKAYGGAISQVYGYTYRNNAARDIEYITMPNGLSSYPLKDVNGRNTGKELKDGNGNKVYGEYITYRKVGDHATNMPSAIWYANGKEIKDNLKYKYDSCGNISEITENGRLSVRYKYDSLNRLVREDNKKFNKTWLYTYDNCGNITSKREAGFTLKPEAEITEYTKENVYGYEGDRLVSKNGEAIEYDSKGNIKKIGNNVLRWWKGKRLESYGQTEFGYDGYGRRATKVHPLEGTTKYIYDSEGRLIKQNGKNTLEYIYDERGVSGFNYNGKEYIYRKNAQGDVTQIKEVSGEAIVEYIYDAWGNCEIMGDREIGKINPYRYRSYYYDESTGLYYLQTRYYSPALGRFISQDDVSYLDPEHINGLNLYAYCGNNPVMNVDPTGTSWSSFWSGVGRFLGGIISFAVGGTISLLSGILAIYHPAATVVCEFGLTLSFYGAGLVGSVFDKEIYSDMNDIGWNPYNSDANAVVLSQKMSFYNGVPIIRANMGSGRSGSFGIILLDSTYVNADTVRHEFGHVPQLMMLGIFRYGLCIGLPSYKNWYNRTSWDYYQAPWDAGADFFGGVTRGYSNTDYNRAIVYLIYSYFLGPLVHAFYKNL